MSYKIDLTFLKTEPNLSKKQGILVIESLSFPSVSNEPGNVYPFEEEPNETKLYGMIENIMGLHFGWRDNYKIRQNILDDGSSENSIDGGTTNKPFQSLISGHFSFELTEKEIGDTFLDPQWFHKKRDSEQIFRGAHTKDYREKNVPESLEKVGYSKTVIERERVDNARWIYQVFCSDKCREALKKCIEDPEAIPYLGDSESIVDVQFVQKEYQ